MAEPLYKSSDVPEFSTYPASPADQAPERAEDLYAPLLVEGSAESERLEHDALNQQLNARARQVGAILGQAVVMMRNVHDSPQLQLVKDRAGEHIATVANSAADLKAQAAEQIDSLSAQATDQYDRLRQRASESLEEARARANQVIEDAQAKIGPAIDRAWEQSQLAVDQARSTARRVRRDYPVQLILAAGAAGFIVGAVLRARRRNA